MKLKFRNIKILSEGQQIKNMVLWGQNPFEDAISKDKLITILSALGKYVGRRKRSFNKLNAQLILSLNRSYYDIVLTPKQQIIKFVDNIANSIKEYKNKNDVKILEKFKRMCLQEGLDYEVARMDWAIGNYYYFQNDKGIAFDFFNAAINAVKGKDNLLFIFYSNSDFTDFREEEKATKYYVQLNKLSNQLSPENIRDLIVPCNSIEGLRLEVIRSLNDKRINPIELFEVLEKIISKENKKQP